MQLRDPLHLPSLAAELGLEIIGDPSLLVTGINEIHKVVPGDLTYCDHPKYYPKALSSPASVVLINNRMECPESACWSATRLLMFTTAWFVVTDPLATRWATNTMPARTSKLVKTA